MRDTGLFQFALGLVPPWMVKACDVEKKRLDIEIDFVKAAIFRVRTAPRPTARCTTPRCRCGGISTSSSIRRSCTPERRASLAPTAVSSRSRTPRNGDVVQHETC